MIYICVCVFAHTQSLAHVDNFLEKYLCFFTCESGHFIDLNWQTSDELSGTGIFSLTLTMCVLTVMFLVL